ncbi:competence protein ComGF [Helicobacter sp. CLO-3]|uniref:HD domain-containing protein n=1 Tax=unclassified Helicobacter TaxID=2593540 RepID=UPI000805CD44|nr:MULTISPECIES: HD domain-containing protein [unclassified Helicobacter]OBV29224.1 competence protein ComGF [Helicobacter sp. CLO-3]OHU84457.1 competence protein ComGF [Helicobacter sp. CLO-3]
MTKPRLTANLLRKIFVAASIRRWNDQACPVEFVELDKQAHKMVITYLFAKYEEMEGKSIDWEKLILYFCFDFFARVVLTDIKPPVFHELQRYHKKELAKFVKTELESDLSAYGFYDDFAHYLSHPIHTIETQILRAAHYYASKWEFDIIYHFNPYMFDVAHIKSIIDDEVEQHYNLNGMKQVILRKKLREIITMFGQLRFQKRWSQTPRVPATSVLGHTLVVAICGYLLSLDFGACKQMRINHFLGGLFHDLPEILTRDIISPIKSSVAGLDEQIKIIEERAVREKIIAHLPESIGADIVYFTQNEFANRYRIEGFTHYSKNADELFEKHNSDEFNPVCGEFLKVCDHLSAFLEAKISIAHGISSQDLVQGAQGILERRKDSSINGIDLGALFREFE